MGLQLLGSLFSPRILIIIAILGVLGFGYYKWTSLENHAAEVAQQLAVEKKNTETLRGNLQTTEAVNESNKVVIQTLQDDVDKAQKAAATLRSNVAKANQDLENAKRKLAVIIVPPVPLSPYIMQALDSIQELRGVKPVEAAEGANVAASAPKDASSRPRITKVVIP